MLYYSGCYEYSDLIVLAKSSVQMIAENSHFSEWTAPCTTEVDSHREAVLIRFQVRCIVTYFSSANRMPHSSVHSRHCLFNMDRIAAVSTVAFPIVSDVMSSERARLGICFSVSLYRLTGPAVYSMTM